MAGCADPTRAVFAGGENSYDNTIQYLTIDSTGNSTDFGDLTVGRAGFSGCSNGHGGISV